ncbi:kinase RLK-Pelle-WAK family protein [Tanacetum coccineum]
MCLQILFVLAALTSLGPAIAQNESHCESSCGHVTINFPFGSGEGCYYSPDFLVTCNRSLDEPTPFYRDTNIPITNMYRDTSEMEVMVFVAKDCYDSFGKKIDDESFDTSLELNNFRISTKNRFVAIGCDTYADITGTIGNDSVSTGCSSTCGGNSHITNGSCSGVGCCQVPIPAGMSSYNLSAASFNNHTSISDFNPCSYALVVHEEKFNFSSNYLFDFRTVEYTPMLLDWAIGNETCDIASKDTDKFLCKGHSECDYNYTGPGYRCRCSEGYEGNPYIANNCTNINECEQNNHDCIDQATCIDKEGTYKCSCKKGYSGDGRKDGTGCTFDKSLIVEISICTSVSVIVLLILVTWAYVGIKKRKHMKLREKFFRKNGGIMLQQRISRDGGSRDRLKVLFTAKELKRATNNYDASKIIGKGGFGTVFKGVLSDNRIVAVKKSKLVDQTKTQIEQFINEVVILSQINHRNVVKLIGCCLETEVPLLVYEFIPNGTLSDHIHNRGKSLAISWEIRIRIATETAEALSYLHSAASVPIVHRDIKPTNILLDDSYVAKVADFGASRLIPGDHIELATIVQGTLGYLDPEYLQTNTLTDKSDVYSFGVVLAELFTGRKALSFDKPEEEQNLAMYFLSSLKKGRLFHILDEKLQLNEVPNEIVQVSRLAERCLCVKGDERPTMKEVAIELEGILASLIHSHPWVQGSSNKDEAERLLIC